MRRAARPRWPRAACRARCPSPSRRALRPPGSPCSRRSSCWLVDHMAAPDRGVANPHGAAVLIDLDAVVVCGAQPTVESPPALDWGIGADGDALPHGAAVVLGLDEGAVEAR